MSVRVILVCQFECDGAEGGRGAVLGCESELAAAALKMQEGVRPGIEIGRTTQAVTGSCRIFAGVVNL